MGKLMKIARPAKHKAKGITEIDAMKQKRSLKLMQCEFLELMTELIKTSNLCNPTLDKRDSKCKQALQKWWGDHAPADHTNIPGDRNLMQNSEIWSQGLSHAANRFTQEDSDAFHDWESYRGSFGSEGTSAGTSTTRCISWNEAEDTRNDKIMLGPPCVRHYSCEEKFRVYTLSPGLITRKRAL